MQNLEKPTTDWHKAKQVDAIKNIIRSHSYTDTMKIFNECASQGLVVSFSALAKFAAKLENADKSPLTYIQSHSSKPTEVAERDATGDAVADKVEYLFNGPPERIPPVPAHVKAQKQAKLVKAQQKEQELVMELGELRIEEQKLMKEISMIREVIEHLS